MEIDGGSRKMQKIGVFQIGPDTMIGPMTLEKIARNMFADVGVLINNNEGFAAESAADIQGSLGDVMPVVGGTDGRLLDGADLVIITGAERDIRGMMRKDRISMNKKAFTYVSGQINAVAPKAQVILAPFGITSPEALKGIVDTAKACFKQRLLDTILPPEVHGVFGTEGVFTLSERILSAVEAHVNSD